MIAGSFGRAANGQGPCGGANLPRGVARRAESDDESGLKEVPEKASRQSLEAEKNEVPAAVDSAEALH